MKNATYRIKLSGLRFHSYHGVLPQEQKIGNEFMVSVSVSIPFNLDILNDNLEATISYADIYDIVADEMQRARKLLETVAATISLRIKEKWPHIIDGNISICKSTPPIAGITGSSEVEIFF